MATLFYDADCGFCRWAAAKVVAWDRHGAVRMVALQDRAEAERLLAAMPEEARMASWHLVTDAGVYSAGAALPVLLRMLPGGAPLRRRPRLCIRSRTPPTASSRPGARCSGGC